VLLIIILNVLCRYDRFLKTVVFRTQTSSNFLINISETSNAIYLTQLHPDINFNVYFNLLNSQQDWPGINSRRSSEYRSIIASPLRIIICSDTTNAKITQSNDNSYKIIHPVSCNMDD